MMGSGSGPRKKFSQPIGKSARCMMPRFKLKT
jgi:hypothetical protein